ncbi:UNVERIFIED_CONTAM: hypothetical protein FKN15_001666 [Acipenser sinensis]
MTSQLPFSSRNLRANVRELPTSGGQRPALQVSTVSSLGAWPARFAVVQYGENSPCRFCLPNSWELQSQAMLPSEIPSEDQPTSHSQDANLRCMTRPAHHAAVLLLGEPLEGDTPFLKAYEQTHSDTDKHSEQALPAALAGKRSKSAVEVVFAAELERSKPEADPATFNHSRSSSFSCFEAEG